MARVRFAVPLKELPTAQALLEDVAVTPLRPLRSEPAGFGLDTCFQAEPFGQVRSRRESAG